MPDNDTYLASRPLPRPTYINPTPEWPHGFYCDDCGEPATRLRITDCGKQYFRMACEVHKEWIDA